MQLGSAQKHILKYARKAYPYVVWPQCRQHEKAADRLVERGLLELDELKQKFKMPCYRITAQGMAANADSSLTPEKKP